VSVPCAISISTPIAKANTMVMKNAAQ